MKRPARRRSRDPKVERLSQVELFSTCGKRELARIAALTVEIEVPAGRVLMREGDRALECFVIEQGTARVTIRGRRATKVGPGDCFGEMALLLPSPARRSATVTAESDMRLLVLTSREFSALLKDVPSVAQKVLAVVGERLRNAERAQPHH
jgi:CRP-like cAMP-binding protein